MAAADTELAEEFGVSEDVVLAIRKNELREGEHWTRGEGGRVVYSEAGLIELQASLGLQKKGAAEIAPLADPVRLKVLQLYPNVQFVRVGFSSPAWLDVKVRDNTRIRVGQVILCGQQASGQWWCVDAGNRPRS